MTTTPARIPCPAGEWTQTTSGSSSVLLQGFQPGTNNMSGFLVAAGAAPPGTIDNIGIIVTPADRGFRSGSLSGTDNTYVLPLGNLDIEIQAMAS